MLCKTEGSHRVNQPDQLAKLTSAIYELCRLWVQWSCVWSKQLLSVNLEQIITQCQCFLAIYSKKMYPLLLAYYFNHLSRTYSNCPHKGPWLLMTDLDHNSLQLTTIFLFKYCGERKRNGRSPEGGRKRCALRSLIDVDWFYIDQFSWGRNK